MSNIIVVDKAGNVAIPFDETQDFPNRVKHTITPEIQEVLDAGGPFLWVDGKLTKVELPVNSPLRAGLIQAWENTFTAGERAFLKPVFTEALSSFDNGDIAKSKEIVATAPSISKDLDAKKAFIVGLFPI